MSTHAFETSPGKPTRDQALAVAARRKAARSRRTSRIRRVVATIAVAAFIGPFGVIYAQMSGGDDPALNTVARVSTAPATSTARSTTAPSTTRTPAPVTTQQS